MEYKKIEKLCDTLQHEAVIRKKDEIAISNARYEGYIQGTEDLLKAIRKESENEKNETNPV